MLTLETLPRIDLRQLLTMTDSTGILQHAKAATPDLHHGYCTDDNARALIATVMEAKLNGYDESRIPLQRYLAFLAYAFNPEHAHFRNFMSYDRRWMEEVGSQDSHGRAVWALGFTASQAPNELIQHRADDLLHKAAPKLTEFKYIRSWAFGLAGLNAYTRFFPDDQPLVLLRNDLADRLYDIWKKNAKDDWPWWEDLLIYANGKLAQALIESGHLQNNSGMTEAGLKALRWLIDIQTADDGHLSIIGNYGWYERGGRRAQFDQQPIEAQELIHACVIAADISHESFWIEKALTCLEWFFGRNDLCIPLYHEDTGGCHDGLQPDRVNMNQGAESTLAYLMSLLELHLYRNKKL